MDCRTFSNLVSLERLTLDDVLDVFYNDGSLPRGSEYQDQLQRPTRVERNRNAHGLAALCAPVAATSPTAKMFGYSLSLI